MKTLRCPCGTRAEQSAPSWLDENWLTEGGETIHVVACPRCRGVNTPLVDTEHTPGWRDEGSCNGGYLAPDAWFGVCYDRHNCGRVKTWSCWQESCVRAWALEHAGCHVEVNRGLTG